MSVFLDTRDAPGRTRIKLCGFTREADVDAACALDVDALGFVFYPRSPRRVSMELARTLVARVPPSIATVGLVVDASRDEIAGILDAVPLDALQLHGDEPAVDYAWIDRPIIKAARVEERTDLLSFAASHATAHMLLLDAHSAGYGGSGKTFEWSRVPDALVGRAAKPPVIVSGGLDVANVGAALDRLGPYGVDVSSGIERAKGIKDAAAMTAFVAAVRRHDASPRRAR